jgi:hypothetical protein
MNEVLQPLLLQSSALYVSVLACNELKLIVLNSRNKDCSVMSGIVSYPASIYIAGLYQIIKDNAQLRSDQACLFSITLLSTLERRFDLDLQNTCI